MIQEFKKIWKIYAIGMIWLLGLLWPLLGVHEDGTFSFENTITVWGYILAGTLIYFFFYVLNKSHDSEKTYLTRISERVSQSTQVISSKAWVSFIFFVALAYPIFTGRYAQDIAIFVLIYICLGLGLNIVVGLAGMLDLGYIAFYGIGAYTYALLSVHYQVSFWLSLPVSALTATIGGCIIGYPTLKMRGDYLAIVTLGFGEIVRIILNNWMSLTNGPNGILRIKRPDFFVPQFSDGFSIEYLYIKKLHYLYYVALFLAIITIIGVYRLNHSRIGRAWESIREDETASELMGVNTFKLKLLAYAMGAMFGGIAGAFFASRMKFVSPQSFNFLESAMVLAMVVLGGMGSIPGVILGAAVLIVLPEVFRDFELYRMLVFGFAMIAMMIVKPKGLIPAKRVEKRLHLTEE